MRPDSPLVSVVIPAYNAGRFIAEALDSVFAQDYPALEVLVIDDGSTDDTREVVARYGERVTLVRQQNAGAAVARNTGIERARGEYLAFLDADDVWLPGKLRHQIAHLERHPEVGMCCSKWELWYPEVPGRYRRPAAAEPQAVAVDPGCSGWIYCELLIDCYVWTSTVVMRRALAAQIGPFDPALRRGQDYDYWLRASRLFRIDRLDAPLALYRMEEGAQARKHPDTNWELAVIGRAIERWGIASPDGRELPRARLRARLWELNFRFGYSQFHNGHPDRARAAFASALHERPFHAKTLLYFLGSRVRTLGSRSAVH